MKFKEIHTLSKKELFISQLEDMILSGELKPGEKLPTEREMADEMNVSKTIVHDGISELVRIGFLEVVSRKGVYVADYTMTGNLETLFAIIRYSGNMPDLKMITSLLDVREYLECPAVASLCGSRTQADLVRLYDLEERLNEISPDDTKALAELLFLYRRMVVVLSGNCISPLIMNAFYAASIPAWIDFCRHIGYENVCRSIRLTTKYIEEKNKQAAVSLLKNNINDYRLFLMKKTAVNIPEA